MPTRVLDGVDGVVLERTNRLGVPRVVAPLQPFRVGHPVLTWIQQRQQ